MSRVVEFFPWKYQFFNFLLATPKEYGISVPRPGIKPTPTAVKALSEPLPENSQLSFIMGPLHRLNIGLLCVNLRAV